MKKQNKYIIGALIILLGISLALWHGRKSSTGPSHPTDVADGPPAFASAAKAQAPVIPPTPPHPVAVPSITNSDPLKFGEMGVLKRNAYLKEIGKQDLASIFRIWLEAGRVDHDLIKQAAIGTSLGYELQKRPPDAAFYAQLQKFIADDSNSRNERGELLLNILGIPQTKESLDLLIQTATTSPDEGIRNTASSAIQSINLCHEELSPSLEQVWQNSHDQYLLVATAVAMAKVGAPSGIQILLSSALSPDVSSDIRKKAALSALLEVRNPDAVPILTDLLARQPPTSESSKLVSSILAEMVFPVAAKSLVNWLQTADASAAPLALSYALKARTPALLEACQSALDPSVLFRSEENREAIRKGLAQRQAGYKNKL